MWRELEFTATEVFAQRTSLNFVDSIWEIFGPLLHGARLVVLPVEHEQDPVAIARWLRREQITHLVIVPVLLDELLTASSTVGVPAALRSVISSGEALSPVLVERCAAIWPQAELINTYGTSETWDASYYRVAEQSRALRTVPIGKPVANASLYILDATGQPVPPGAVGELHVGGLALAQEYVGNPELTRQRFVANPFVADPSVAEPGARLYRTGDLASYRADGNIILAGRADRQIKLRGLRIEAGDIESRALKFSGVRQCALRLQQPAKGEPWLALYVVADPAMLDRRELRAHLQAALPRALVPADICVLDRLPLTPSGKLDVNALPALSTPAAAAGLYVAPRDTAEERLAAIWQTALGVPQVGVHDDFFALRGHSLLAVQVIARICDEFAVELPLQALFEAPTVAGLARSVAALRWTRPGQHWSDGRADDRADDLGGEREVLRL
jgi:acyl-coenzyme A synthetase/AMP-(fatty) acid ligase/acyl carrier protein